MPDWDACELKGMGHSLKTHIVARQNMRFIIERRLDWQDTVASKLLWSETIQAVTTRYKDHEWLIRYFTVNPYETKSRT